MATGTRNESTPLEREVTRLVGEAIRASGMSQHTVSRKLDGAPSPSMISRMTRGLKAMTVGELERICTVVGVRASDLVREAEGNLRAGEEPGYTIVRVPAATPVTERNQRSRHGHIPSKGE